MVAPEHVAVKGLYTTRPLLLDFFAKLFTPGNFFAVWRYMRGYVEFEGSSELGQYYMKCWSSLTGTPFLTGTD